MPRQRSDFQQGVEAAAKWLKDRFPASSMLADKMAIDVVREIADDPEGTEARTVAQIVQFMRETAFGNMYEDQRKAILRAAESISVGDWKRA